MKNITCSAKRISTPYNYNDTIEIELEIDGKKYVGETLMKRNEHVAVNGIATDVELSTTTIIENLFRSLREV